MVLFRWLATKRLGGDMWVTIQRKFTRCSKIAELLAPVASSGTASNIADALVEQPRKKIRYDQDVITIEDVVFNSENEPAPWLSLNQVWMIKKRSWRESNWQTNINYTQAVLKKQFDRLSGLHSTLVLSKLANALSSDVVQIIHSRNNHWIVASSIGCSTGKVLMFDSLYSSVDQATTNLIH